MSNNHYQNHNQKYTNYDNNSNKTQMNRRNDDYNSNDKYNKIDFSKGELKTRGVSNKANDERKLFVGGLTWETSKDHLVQYFSKYGRVEDASVKLDFNTGRSRGFGFILFDKKETLEKVLSIREHIVNGKSIEAKPAKHKSNVPQIKKIFIGGLDPNYPEAELRQYFSKYGKIEEIEMPFDKMKNQRKSYCFISFESEDVVNEILKKPKHTLGGKEVDVKQAAPPKDSQNQLLQAAQLTANMQLFNQAFTQYPSYVTDAAGYMGVNGVTQYPTIDPNLYGQNLGYTNPQYQYGTQTIDTNGYINGYAAPQDGLIQNGYDIDPNYYGYQTNGFDQMLATQQQYDQNVYYQNDEYQVNPDYDYYATTVTPTPTTAANGIYNSNDYYNSNTSKHFDMIKL